MDQENNWVTMKYASEDWFYHCKDCRTYIATSADMRMRQFAEQHRKTCLGKRKRGGKDEQRIN